ncbi:MAG: V-type ATPase subunit [Trueperaceae bacterium]|nr:V-type ATPase subunit [Trueperaceae bacterium]
MPADFGYINARVRGLKSRLLGAEFYNEALNATDFGAFTSALSQSPYMRDVEEAQAQHSGLQMVDEAITRNFRRTTQGILGFSDGSPEALISIFLLRYDLNNLKAIARAKHAGREVEDIREALLPAGRLKPAVLDTIAAAPDLPGAAQSLAVTKHPLASSFTRAVSQYSSEGDLFGLELSLDRAYYRVILDILDANPHPQQLERHLQLEIDAVNIRTALKVRGRQGASGDLYIPGGREVSRGDFERLSAEASKEALQPLSTTSFSEVADAETLSGAEEAIRTVIDQSAKRLYLRDPLNIGVVLHFLRLKEVETARLRLLARGKFYGVPRRQLEQELGHG